jgi:amidophosphoribosyltransferase
MAYQHSIEEIRSSLNMDSLGYLSIEGITGILEPDGENYCTACWTGTYLNKTSALSPE